MLIGFTLELGVWTGTDGNIGTFDLALKLGGGVSAINLRTGNVGTYYDLALKLGGDVS